MSSPYAEERTPVDLGPELASLIGKDHVSSGDTQQLDEFAIDGVVPGVVVSPGSAQEVGAILRIANERKLIVVPACGRTKQTLGATPEKIDILLRTTRLDTVEHYDPGDLTVGVGAGTTIAGLQRTLAANSQFLPLDPMLPERATIGGVMATNSHGPLKSGYGGVRDFCIGVQFVTAEGTIAKGGGRVVKNVAGYDLMKLMIGSLGTLGVITSANFKVFPRPVQTRTFAAQFANVHAAIAFRDRMIASPLAPMCLEIVSPRAQEYLGEIEAARDPDHYAPLTPIHSKLPWKVYLRAAGSDAVLARYRREIGVDSVSELEGNKEADLWRWISDCEASMALQHRNAMIMYVNLPVADVGAALTAAEETATEHNLLSASFGRIAAGALMIAFLPIAVDPPSAMQFATAASAFRSKLSPDASATVVRCAKEAKVYFNVWGTTPTDLATMRALRSAMDPNRILNRGRFLV